jgi:hypothetical protein
MKTVINQGGGVYSVIALEDGNLITGTVQDCTPIAEDAKARHREGLHGTKEMKHAARLPAEAVEAYCNINGITFSEFMQNPVHTRLMCNDPALKDFRIWPGRV